MLFPFPGMNPYLEDPDLWAGFHHWLTTLITYSLVPQLRNKYRAAIGIRVYPIEPMFEEKEAYLEVREVGNGAVVTIIEILSPKTKYGGDERKSYEVKRQKVLSSETHLVEIDLLRGETIPTSYQIRVSRSNCRPKTELYPFELTEPIPTFFIPLREGDTEPLLDLQTLIQEVYDRAGLDMAIDYTRKPVPELSEADEAWADNLLRQQGLR